VTNLPQTGLLRLPQVIGDRARGIPGVVPVGRTMWLEGVKTGRFPAPVRVGLRAVAWRCEDIHKLLDDLAAQPYAPLPSRSPAPQRKPRRPKGSQLLNGGK
jgi:prophage regulatory protein